MEYVLIAIAILVVALLTGISLLVNRGRRTTRLDSDAAAGTTLTRPRPPQPTAEQPPPGPAPTSGATSADLYQGPPAPSPNPGWSSRPRCPRPAGWSGCAPGSPARSRRWGAAC
jgi:fused signal recognition particle receptor